MKEFEIIGESIKKARVQKGIKQESLARHLGITKGRLSQIEKGNCERLTLSRIKQIAVYLEVDFFEILSGSSQLFQEHKNSGDGSTERSKKINETLVKSLFDDFIEKLKMVV